MGVGPYDDVLMDEAKRFRQVQDMNRAKLDDKFGTFIDKSPCFPHEENPEIKLPQSLCGIDKIEVTSQIHELIKKQEKTQFHATFFRDRCEELQQRIRQLETEKEGVRYFWRNKILEGQCRSGKILKLAIGRE